MRWLIACGTNAGISMEFWEEAVKAWLTLFTYHLEGAGNRGGSKGTAHIASSGAFRQRGTMLDPWKIKCLNHARTMTQHGADQGNGDHERDLEMCCLGSLSGSFIDLPYRDGILTYKKDDARDQESGSYWLGDGDKNCRPEGEGDRSLASEMLLSDGIPFTSSCSSPPLHRKALLGAGEPSWEE